MDNMSELGGIIEYPHGHQENPTFSIIFPHLKTPQNDECLTICLDYIKKNTKHPYELIICLDDPSKPRWDPYKSWNEVIPLAKSDNIIFSNTDVIFTKNWDVPFVNNFNENTIITQYLIECGAIGVHMNNIQKDFGKTPTTFNYNALQNFANTNPNAPCTKHLREEKRARHNGIYDYKCPCRRLTPEVSEELGWYMPSYMHRKLFIRAGMFKTDVPFMYRPNDAILFEDCQKLGAKIIRVKSYAYHFQNLSHKVR